jgi:hypothetical protein
VYIEIQKGMYGLKQAGLLANQLLQTRLAPFGYYPARHTPGLWLHNTRPISFTLIVDDFAVKYVGKQHDEHLRNALLKTYELTIIYLNFLILSEKFTAPSAASHDVSFDCIVFVARGFFGAISTGMVQPNLVSMGPTIIIIVSPVGFSDVGCWNASSCGGPCTALHSK